MATADELLMATTPAAEEVLVADLVNRVIVIPASVTLLGVESDDDVKRLHFNVPRNYGEFDLSDFKFHINFENARHQGDFWPVDDLSVNGDMLSFSWLVDRSALTHAGDVSFNICMKKYDENGVVVKELNTTPATLPVLHGLETTKEVVESNPSAFDAVMFRLYAVEAATGNGQNGYYTIAKVEETGTGVEVTIIDKDGQTVATVKHGIDGYTPVKGTDYWTDEDKSEIKNETTDHALAYINSWAPSSTTVTLLGGAENWVNNQQTVTVPGATADNTIIIVSPTTEDDNDVKYANYGICCVSQQTNALIFKCKKVPTEDIYVGIGIYYSASSIGKATVTVTDDGNGNVVLS